MYYICMNCKEKVPPYKGKNRIESKTCPKCNSQKGYYGKYKAVEVQE